MSRRPAKRSIYRNRNLQNLLIGLAIVFFWRGAWGLMDIYIFPASPILSYGFSALAGLALLFFVRGHRLKDLE
jgi:hypothetical protein